MLLEFLMVLPVVLPILFWALYHYHKDRHLPEPVGHLLLAFVLGIGSSYLGTFLYSALDLINLRFDAGRLAEVNVAGAFVYSMLAIGPIEELAKMLPFLLFVVHFKEFDEPIDGIIYASFIALGFALVENISYLQYITGLQAVARGFAGPVVHIVFASIWGYYIGRAYLCGRPMWRTVLTCLVFTAFLHGMYDFIVLAMPPWALSIAAFMIAGIWVWRLSLIRDLHALPSGPCLQELDDRPAPR